jgi:predicted amidohydrolase
MTLRVSAAQMPVTLDVRANIAAITRALHAARSAQADILLTPEGALSGYTPYFDPSAVEAALAEVTTLASELQVGLALGTCFKEPDGLIYDELRFYAPDGAYLGFHSKILRCGTLTEPPEGEINDYAVTPLRTFTFPVPKPQSQLQPQTLFSSVTLPTARGSDGEGSALLCWLPSSSIRISGKW